MKITDLLTDESILRELGLRLERARLDLELTQADLAREAGLAKRTIERIEAGSAYQLPSLLRILRVLQLMDGLEILVPDLSARPMDLLEHATPRRRRASPKRQRQLQDRPETWTWDEEA